MPVKQATESAKQAWAWIKYQAQGKGWLLDSALTGVNDQFASDVIETLADMRRNLTQQRRFLPAENLTWWDQAYSRVIGGQNKQASAVLRLIHKVVNAVPTRPDVIRSMILTPGRPEYEVDRVLVVVPKNTTPVKKVVAQVTDEDPGPNYEKIEEGSSNSGLFWLAVGAGILASTL